MAIVNYRTLMAKPRKGVCTSYIASLAPGELRLALEVTPHALLTYPSFDSAQGTAFPFASTPQASFACRVVHHPSSWWDRERVSRLSEP